MSVTQRSIVRQASIIVRSIADHRTGRTQASRSSFTFETKVEQWIINEYCYMRVHVGKILAVGEIGHMQL